MAHQRRNAFVFQVLVVLLMFCLSSANANDLPHKIDVLQAVNNGEAFLSASNWDIGEVNNCFDGDTTTLMRSSANPAFVQINFTNQVSVSKIGVLLGEFGFSKNDEITWWLEIADNAADMDNKSGSHRTLVSRRSCTAGDWDQVLFLYGANAKIWRLSVEGNKDGHGVSVREIELSTGNIFLENQVRTDYYALVIHYDPRLGAAYGNKKISEYFTWWQDGDELINEYIDFLKRASGGQVNWHVVYHYDLEEFPPTTDPTGPWNGDNYVDNYNGPRIEKDGDYYSIIYDQRFDIINKVETGQIDAVWLMSFPFTKFWETCMAGQGAYYINGPPVTGINCSKKFVIYGFNFEREVGCMLENTSHMTENIMLRHALNWPRTWSFNVYTEVNAWRDLKQRQRNDWEMFALTDVVNYVSYRTDPEAFLMAPGFAQIGTAHYPPNAAYNYGWHWIDESFSNDNRWVAVSGQWNLSNGVYSANGGYGKSLIYDFPDRPYFASSFVMESDINIHSAGSREGAGFIFRCNKYSASANSGNGYYVGFNPELNKVYAAKINNSFSVIDSAQVDFNANEWHRAKIVAMRDSIAVFLDNMSFPVLVINDTSFFDGAFGFATYQTAVSYDNFFINTYAITYADEWYNYPNFSFSSSRMVNSYDWAGKHEDWFCWWFEHIPKNSGTHDGGILNSWWPYILDINRFDQPLGYSNIIFPEKDNQPPQPPLNLSVWIKTSHSIALHWQEPFDNIGVTRYEIYRDNKMIQQVSRPPFTDTGLKPSTFYTYTIKARDGSANVSDGTSLIVQTESGNFFELENGNFEAGSANLPNAWTSEAFNNVADFKWESATGRNNSRCVSIDIPSDQLDDARWIQEVYLLPNKTYKLSGWIKGENITLVQGSIGANICLMGGFEHSPSFSGTFDWQKAELEFVTPADGKVTVACRLGFYGSILHGKAWFDDLSLTLLDSTFQLTGNVNYDHIQTPIPDAEIYIDDEFVCTTNSNGQFAASNVSVGAHTISAMKGETDNAAISGADVLALMKNLAFLITLSDDQRIAADVTKDGELTGADVQAMMRFLAFFSTNTAHTGEWRFFPEDTTIDFNEDTNVDFIGYLLGDVNLNWTNSTFLSKNDHNESAFDLKFDIPVQSENAEIRIPLILKTSDEKMNTLQFSMTYPAFALKFKRIEWLPNMGGFQKVTNSEKEGELHLAVAGVEGIYCNGEIAHLIFEKNAMQKSQIELQFTRAIANDAKLKDLPILTLNRNLAHVPKQFKLFQNYPNPFNAETLIKYQLPRDAHVKLAIYNSLGQKIKTLVDKVQKSGIYAIRWNGKDDDYKTVVSGIYLVRIEAGNFVANEKLILLK